jgi:hypothetical protein
VAVFAEQRRDLGGGAGALVLGERLVRVTPALARLAEAEESEADVRLARRDRTDVVVLDAEGERLPREIERVGELLAAKLDVGEIDEREPFADLRSRLPRERERFFHRFEFARRSPSARARAIRPSGPSPSPACCRGFARR